MQRLSQGLSLFTRPQTRAAGRTGAERQAIRDAAKRATVGPPQPTRETRQNYRVAMRKAIKQARAGK